MPKSQLYYECVTSMSRGLIDKFGCYICDSVSMPCSSSWPNMYKHTRTNTVNSNKI